MAESYTVQASDCATTAGLASSTRILVVAASDSASAGDISLPQSPSGDSATFTDLAVAVMDLGRLRRGDWIPLEFSLQQIPDAIPIAVILDSNSDQIASFMMPATSACRLTYSLPIQVSLAFSVGNFSVFYHYVISGTATLQQAVFEVVPGGDSGGSVIALYSIDRPEVRSIVAQLDSGVLVLGRSPTVKE